MLTDALERMRAENKLGVALRLTTDQHRHDPGHDLVFLFNKDEPDAREVLAEVVFVCLESPVLQVHLKDADPRHNLLVFDEDGHVADSVRFDFAADYDRLGATVRSLVHGPDNSRLRQRTEAIRKKLDPAVIESLDRLGSPGRDPASDAALLVNEAPRIVPLLVRARIESTSFARQDALRGIVEQYAAPSNGSTLPYGVLTSKDWGGCGDDCEEQGDKRSRIACGMARASPNSRSFVRYLTK